MQPRFPASHLRAMGTSFFTTEDTESTEDFGGIGTGYWVLGTGNWPLPTALQLRPQQADYIVRRNHARQLAFIIHHRQGKQVVLVEDLGHFLLVCPGMAGNERL